MIVCALHSFIHVCAYVCVCVFVCMYACMCVCVCVFICLYITKNCLKLVANELLHWEYQIPFLFLLAKAFFFVDIPKVFRKNVISVIIFSEPLVKYSLHSWSHMFKGLDCSVLFNSVLRLKEIICIQSKKRGETVQT